MTIFNQHPWKTGLLLVISYTALALVASAQSLRVTLLGTGSPQPRMDRVGPSILVEAGEKKRVFDCGRGVTQRIEQIKIPFTEIDALFLTHLHSDHVVGIPDLWLTGWARGRKVPLQVWGPAGTKEMMSNLEQAFQFDIRIRQDDDKLPRQGVAVVAKDIDQGVVYDDAGIKVTTFAVDHGLVKPASGYRIDFAGHSVKRELKSSRPLTITYCTKALLTDWQSPISVLSASLREIVYPIPEVRMRSGRPFDAGVKSSQRSSSVEK